jgi:hypothetical protein
MTDQLQIVLRDFGTNDFVDGGFHFYHRSAPLLIIVKRKKSDVTKMWVGPLLLASVESHSTTNHESFEEHCRLVVSQRLQSIVQRLLLQKPWQITIKLFLMRPSGLKGRKGTDGKTVRQLLA